MEGGSAPTNRSSGWVSPLAVPVEAKICRITPAARQILVRERASEARSRFVSPTLLSLLAPGGTVPSAPPLGRVERVYEGPLHLDVTRDDELGDAVTVIDGVR